MLRSSKSSASRSWHCALRTHCASFFEVSTRLSSHYKEAHCWKKVRRIVNPSAGCLTRAAHSTVLDRAHHGPPLSLGLCGVVVWLRFACVMETAIPDDGQPPPP